MVVSIYTDEVEACTIELHQGEFLLTGDVELAERLLSQPVFVLRDGELADVSAEDDPEAWLRGLHRHYKSPYLRATEVK